MSVLNLAAIDSALRELQRVFPQINLTLHDRRDSLDDEVVLNMLEGYALVDRLLSDRVDIFEIGHSSYWLQLNATVLCGTDPNTLSRHHQMLEATDARFYEEPGAGIRYVMDWYSLNKGKDVWRRAAGVYSRILSDPQLFIEGNHRTGALIMSYLLARESQPPFVLTGKNAKGFLDPSSVVKRTKKRNIFGEIKFNRLTREFADFLETQKNSDFLAYPEVQSKDLSL